MAGIGVFVVGGDFFVAQEQELNAATPPEPRSLWWGDHAARSVLRYALEHHMAKLVAEVACRRRGRKARVPGFL